MVKQNNSNRFRDSASRLIISTEVIKGLEQLNLTSDPRAKKLIDDLTIFVNDTTSRQFDGNLEFIDKGFSIEYCLPGRRIISHFVRTKRLNT